MSQIPENAFRVDLRIGDGDIDNLGHVNNVVYLRWVQEAAEAHWMTLADEEQRKAMVWVVLRHEIDYHRAAVPGDAPHAMTWVGETAGVRSVRHVSICDLSGRLLASARTTWCLLDAKDMRPKRIAGDVEDILYGRRLRD